MSRQFLNLLLVFVALAVAVCAAAKADWSFIDAVAQVTNRDGTISYRASHGQFNVQHNIPSYHKAQFPIASNTKLFTAVAMYQLQEAGLVNISANIADYLNATDIANFGFPGVTKYCPRLLNTSISTACQVITFRDLMSMSSGIYAEMRCDPIASAMRFCNPDPFIVYPGSIAAMVGTFIANPLIFVPGTAYEYSNPNFILCAYFIEKLSGMSFGDYLKKNILDVVGMPNTYFDQYNSQFELNANRVGVYHRFVDTETGELMATGQNTIDFDMGSLSGTGGLVSSQDDFAKWYRMLFNFSSKGYPLLKDPASFDALLTPYTFILPPGPMPTYYTQGVIIVCAPNDAGCAKGPTFVIYEGGTLVVKTANLFDVRPVGVDGQRRYQLTQVWANSHIFNMTRTTYDTIRTRGTGNFFRLAGANSLPTIGAVGLAWQLQGQFGPSPMHG